MAGPASQSGRPDPWAEFEEVSPANFWENDPLVSDGPQDNPFARYAQQPSAPPQGRPWERYSQHSATTDPVFVIPDPAGARDAARDDRSEQRDIAAEGRANRTETRTERNDMIGNEQGLRKEYNALAPVAEYRTVARSYASALNTAADANGDQALITAYAKLLDPGSVVREGEAAAVADADSTIGRAISNLKREFGITGGGKLSPAVRAGIRTEMRNLVEGYNAAYEQTRTEYEQLAQSYGFEPDRIIGGHILDPYREQIDSYWTTNETPEAATMQDAVREDGARVEFGMDRWGRDDVFDRNEYLISIGFPEGETSEARLTASLNRLAGQEVSPTQIAAIYGQLGIALPSDEGLAEIATQLREGGVGGINTAPIEQQYIENLRRFNEGSAAENYGTAALGTHGMSFLLSDEMAGLGEGAKALVAGRNPITGYQVGRDAERLALEEARERTGGWGTAAELAGGILTGGVRMIPALARSGAKIAPTAINEARAAGAVAGFGGGEGAADSVTGAVVGAATGDIAARGIGAVANKLRSRAPTASQAAGREVIDAADRTNARTGSNIQPLPADVAGANVRRATGGVTQSTFGAGPVVRASQRVNDEAQTAVETLAAREGRAGTPQAAGEQAIAGADKTMKRLRTRVDANYARARRLSGDTRVPLNNARATLDQHLAEVADTPGGSRTADTLAELRDGIDGNWTPEGIRRMRTEWRDRFIKDGLRGTDQERRVNDIIDAAELDIEQGLVQAGRTEAAVAWKRASQAAAERFQLIDDVITPIIGRRGERSGEGAFAAIERLSRGDAVALGRFMRALPADEAGSVRATVISRLGRSTKGQQDADGESFSLARFLTNWNDEGLSKEAKGALFSGELRAALDDVARVAQGTKEAQRYANHSNTSGANGVQWAIGFSPLAFFDLATGALVAGGSIATQNSTGRLLASPAFARWLAGAGKVKTSGAARAHTDRLTKIAAADTAVGAEIIDLQQYLLQQLEGAPTQPRGADRLP
jgi:hypothetical protein